MKRLCSILFLILALGVPAFAQQDILKGSTAYVCEFLLVQTDHIAGATGLTPTVTINKNGGSYASPSGSVSEIAHGKYKIALNATDTNTDGPINGFVAATGSNDPSDFACGVVVDWDPRSVPTLAEMVTAISAQTVKKNTAFSNYPIWMLSSNGTAQTGLSTSQISCQVSKDSGSWAAVTDTTESEIGLGKYVVDLTAGELNANAVSIVCTGPAGTQPYRTNITPQR